jgi:hypothetical protein
MIKKHLKSSDILDQYMLGLRVTFDHGSKYVLHQMQEALSARVQFTFL